MLNRKENRTIMIAFASFVVAGMVVFLFLGPKKTTEEQTKKTTIQETNTTEDVSTTTPKVTIEIKEPTPEMIAAAEKIWKKIEKERKKYKGRPDGGFPDSPPFDITSSDGRWRIQEIGEEEDRSFRLFGAQGFLREYKFMNFAFFSPDNRYVVYEGNNEYPDVRGIYVIDLSLTDGESVPAPRKIMNKGVTPTEEYNGDPCGLSGFGHFDFVHWKSPTEMQIIDPYIDYWYQIDFVTETVTCFRAARTWE